MELNEEQLVGLIKEYESPVYIPNNGNAGDSLIAKGSFDFFDKHNISWSFGKNSHRYEGRNLFYAGGGNLVGMYGDCKRWLDYSHNKNNILILPHTVKDSDSILSKLGGNVTIICRDFKSYEYVKRFKVRTFLHKDMAHYINMDGFSERGSGIANFFRLDCEKTNHRIPIDNVDISNKFMTKLCTSNRDEIDRVVVNFINKINDYKIINTNRLHVAIGGMLLGKEVYLHPNSYWKNEEVWKYSLKDKVSFNK